MSHPYREQAASRAFVVLADTLVDDYEIIDLLDQLVAHSAALLAVEAAGIAWAIGLTAPAPAPITRHRP